MRLVSFNANSIRKRLSCGQFQDLIAAHEPALIGVQETKVSDAEFPFAAIEELGYSSAVYGMKARHGVALLSKLPMSNVELGLPNATEDSFARVISADIELGAGLSARVLNGYFPQGQNRSHPSKFPHKQRFYQALIEHLRELLRASTNVIVMGDMNVARADIDIGLRPRDMERWLQDGACCFLPEEQQWLEQLFGLGLHDSYRELNPDGDLYSWFDYRTRAFAGTNKRGLRIDYVLLTPSLLAQAQGAGIDYQLRGHASASDHAPIWLDLSP